MKWFKHISQESEHTDPHEQHNFSTGTMTTNDDQKDFIVDQGSHKYLAK